jgi:hypothetical protein
MSALDSSRRNVSAERDASTGQSEQRHDDQPYPRQQRVFKTLEGCPNFLTSILERQDSDYTCG